MARLIFVHGMNNQGNKAEDIKRVWGGALNQTLQSNGLPQIAEEKIIAAEYGDLLHDMASDRSNDTDEQELEKFADLLNNEFALYEDDQSGEPSYLVGEVDELVLNEGFRADEGRDGERAGDRGLGKRLGHTRISITAAHLVNDIFPGASRLVLSSFMKQTGAYLNHKDVFEDINQTVKQQVFEDGDDELVIVSHSLGTAVAYYLLCQGLGKGRVKALYTIGSPLGIDFFLRGLEGRGANLSYPEELPKWYNCWDKRDFVSLNKAVDDSTIGFSGATNINTFNTSKQDRHAIVSYLRHEFLARMIYSDFKS